MSRPNSKDRELREARPGGDSRGHVRPPVSAPAARRLSAVLLPRPRGRLWDADGNEMLDFMCAYGPNLLGYGDAAIDAAFSHQLDLGDAMTGPTGLMVELAEAMTAMVSHADWAMFCKNGSDATLMALMTARTHTRRATVILAKGAYHGAAPWCAQRPVGTIPPGQGRRGDVRLQRCGQPGGGGPRGG